jgi:hypothetical protein
VDTRPIAGRRVVRGLHNRRSMLRLARTIGATLGALALGLTGCATYSPGSFASRGQAFTGQAVTLGCLDLAIAGTRDAIAPGPVVDYQFGNRCDRAIGVDFRAIRATGRTARGEQVALVAYDPYGEITGKRLEARTAGRERLEYRAARDLSADLIEVCVEVGAITAGATPTTVCVEPGRPRIAEVTP